MNKITIGALLATFFAAFAFTACDTSSDVTETETSRDCLITSVTLGTLVRDVHTKSASTGKDTTITYNVTGGAFLMYIDQLKDSIYNPDPLPVGTRVNKLVFASNGIVGSGKLMIESLTTHQDTLFIPTDSTDFSVPRKVTVYSVDGSIKRSYKFNINVYKEYPDSMVWNTVTESPLNAVASFVKNRTLSANGMLYVFGENADGTTHVVATTTEAPNFDESSRVQAANGEKMDVRSIQYLKGNFYALAGGHVVKSAQAAGTWHNTEATQTFTAMVGTSTDSLFAISGGQIWASADGANWKRCTLDTEGALPTQNITASNIAARNNKNNEVMIMVGQDAKNKVSVWKHDINLKGDFSYPWILLPQTDELKGYTCPQLKDASLFAYNGNTVLAGISADGSVAPFYVSEDNGRTWKTSLLYNPTPQGATSLSVTVDANHFVWMVCGGTGKVLKGRLNRLGNELNAQ